MVAFLSPKLYLNFKEGCWKYPIQFPPTPSHNSKIIKTVHLHSACY